MSSDAAGGALAAAKRIGVDVEVLVVQDVDALRSVPDDVALFYDAVAVGLIDGSDDVVLGGTPLVPRGALVDELLVGRWYDSGEDGDVAKLSWTSLLQRGDLA